MNDRCDRCGAAGQARFVKGDQELTFCGHHTHEYGSNLEKAGFHEDAIAESISALVVA